MYKLLALAIFLLAMNLRVPLLSITPLLQFIRIDYGFTNSIAGLLTTLPLLVFALISSFMAHWSHKYGVGKVIVSSILFIIIGELVRYFGGVYGLFIGTVIIALGITAGNVLIPALIRGFFPQKIGFMTGCYSAIMQVSTTIALLTAVPLSFRIGWSQTLLLLVILAIFALVCWSPFRQITFASAKTGFKGMPIIEDVNVHNETHELSIKKLFRQSLAWDVSLFMGIQSILFYSVSTWLPTIIVTKQLSPVVGGYMGFVYQLVSLMATFVTPFLVGRFQEQKWAALISCIFYALGILGLFTCNSEILLTFSVGFAGIGAGSTFAIALLYFALRTYSADASAMLSGVGQAVGYILASIGPVFIGYLYDIQGNWLSTMILLLIFCFLFAFTGYRAGRNRKIAE